MDEPQKIGKYELETLLGKGGMGEVWLSRDPDLNIPVAVKVLFESLTITDPTYLQRFMMEASHAAKLNHPNVVRIYSAGRDGNRRYMVMEYLPGGSAKEMLDDLADPELQSRCRRVIRDAANGLTAAAKAGIVHRDIKPANILFDEDGVAKLADLGIGKGVGGVEEHELTMTGNVVGTPFYMAPEQATDSKRVDVRSDLYALGATWYHLASGEVPFTGETSVGIMLRHVQEERPDPRQVNPQISAADAMMIQKLMSLDPIDRYQTPTDLLADMDKAAAGLLVVGDGGRGRRILLAVVAALVLVAILAAVMMRGGDDQPPAVAAVPPVVQATDDPPALVVVPTPPETNVPEDVLPPEPAITAPPETQPPEPLPLPPEPQQPADETPDPAAALAFSWVSIPAGSFEMGSNDPLDNDRGPAAAPPHQVEFPQEFEMSAKLVTKAQFAAFCEATEFRTSAERNGQAEHYGEDGWLTVPGASWRTASGRPDHPVVDVSWHDAVAYCQWLTRRGHQSGELPEDLVYRLPTEAEWEYACRAGTQTPYFFGATASDFAEFANCRDQASGLADGNLWFERTAAADDGQAQLAPVGSYKPNPWGLYDMLGNVWEWCLDSPRDFQSRGETNPRGRDSDSRRVFRGGSWDAGVNQMRAAYRFAGTPGRAANNLGFRIVKAAP